jgi:hypothetical protein
LANQVNSVELTKWFGNLRAIKRIVSITYNSNKKVYYYNMEERYPGLSIEQKGHANGYVELVKRWLDGLCNTTAQRFKDWMLEKIGSIPKIKSEGCKLILLSAPATPKKIWIKKLSRGTKKWIAQYPYFARWSVMTSDDEAYS